MQFIAPQTTPEAVELLAKSKGRAHVLAGGSDLLVRMKSGDIEPDVIVDIKRIGAMQSLKKSPDGFVIGAAVPCIELSRHKQLAKAWPGLVEAASLIGSDQIQGRCTIVGNLCNGSPAADSVPAMIAAHAVAVVHGPRGKRQVPVEKVVTAPGKLSLRKGELIEAIVLPPRSARSADAYLRFTPRTEMDIAVVSAAVNLSLQKGVVSEATVVLGAVAPTAVTVKRAAKALLGSRLDDESLDKLKSACREACAPIDDKRGTVAYRKQVAGVLAARAALVAFERCGGKR